MKSIYLKIFSVFFATIALTSCEDEDKNPLFVDQDPGNLGVFVTITKGTDVIDFTDSSSTYDFTIESPSNTARSIDISVQRIVGEDSSAVVPITSSNTIPATFSLTAAEISEALNIPVTDFGAGDQFDFSSTVTGTDGSTASFANLNGDSTGPGQFQGFNHTTFLSCPFSASEALGSYSVTTDTFGVANTNFEVVAGPDDGTVTIVGLFTEDFNISVNTKTGLATIPRQPVEPAFFGYSGGNINTSATSFYFSCTGAIVLTVQYTVDLGSFGNAFKLSAQRN